ncbi:MAG: Fe-S protein assembly chaperone HscA [Bryobacter sp.]|nr:Fe-S protein assembly chaperone HscA [Bryobacter sp.]
MGTFQIDFGDSPKERIIGIDLGTTNSLAAFQDLTGPEIIPTAEGGRIVPSVVSVGEDGAVLAGQAAKDQLKQRPRETVYSAKRFMGKGPDDIREELAFLPFSLASTPASAENNIIRLQVGPLAMTAPEISAHILAELKRNAEAYFGEPVTKAVVTVPAYFNDAQRQATKDAGRIAGLEVLRLVNEPTAAALAYGLDKRNQGVIAVYDLGGGTFDISILRIQDGIFEVLATNGDTHLGGDDIDKLLLEIALEDIASEWGFSVREDASAVETIRQAVIAAKEQLSFVPETQIDVDYQGRKYQRHLDRGLFDKLIAPVIERTVAPCRQCLKDAGLAPEQIDEVVLVGGSTRIPYVRKVVQQLFQAIPHTELNPDEVVALGAAVQAGILAGDVADTLLLDVTPLSLGIETMGGVVSKLIHRNSTIPASATEQFTTAVDGQTNVLIHVLQGERELVKDCRSLARFDLKGIPPMQAGLARIEVKFLIDANGILNVSAKDLRSGLEHSVEVKPSYGLTDEQVEAMILASIENAERDVRERQVREARVEADRILAAVEKARNSDAWLALDEAQQSAVQQAINELLLAYHGEDHLVIHAHMEKLDEATRSLAESMMNTAVASALKGTKI